MRFFAWLLLIFMAAKPAAMDNFFKKFIEKFRDNNTSPCEDFFRHMCPRNLPHMDTYQAHTRRLNTQWTDPGMGWIKQMLKNVDVTPVNIYDSDDLSKDMWATLYISFLKEVGKLPKRAALIYASQKEAHPLHSYDYDRLEDMYKKFSEMIAEELNHPGNPSYNETLMEEWKNLTIMQEHHFGLNNETMTTATTYLELFEHFFQTYNIFISTYDRPFLDSREALRSRYEEVAVMMTDVFLKWNATLTDEMYLALINTKNFNAANYFDYKFVVMTETIFAGIMRENVPEAIFIGVAGVVTAHELFHTYLRLEHVKPEGDHPILQQVTDCTIEHYEKSCELWREGDCHSGKATWSEDAVDIEGVQLAWKLLKKRMGGKLKEMLYPDLGVTHEQMFFYSFAILFCSDYRTSLHSPHESGVGWDVHSGSQVRYNALFSLLKPFQEAFNCQAADKMVQRSQCNYFGEEVRR